VGAATVFDEVVYGRRDPTPLDVEEVEAGFRRVLAEVRSETSPAATGPMVAAPTR
jgi:hypothetical protein